MSINKPNDQTRSPVRKVLDICGIIILISVMGYYSNKTVQGYLGQQAIDATGLESITLEEALQVAKRSNKLVLADMSAIWCPACRKLDEQVFSNERVKTQLKQDFVYVRIEYESPEGKSFMQNYQVTGFPTLLVLNTKAEKLIQLPINYEPLPFLATLEKVVDSRR
ncbi:thioredoxin family protein [uncultured Paraglaciecola sp.]|jgi:thiol:disulfide interchange protein|uniref:thioredoxin family protein n=1 Tax=uncultured Paraglaciecola sp. TaxID=1765024 RepID=UPI0025D0BD4A|nr:thioredoxin family protein [uncultured Paraglaciecola sp.]